MSTVQNVAAGDLAPCWHCRRKVTLTYGAGGCQVRCMNDGCWVRGPELPTDLEAMQAWNAVRAFGRVGVVHGRAGIPNHTTALAENLRLVSENMAAGVYDDPCGFAIMLAFDGRSRAHVVPHNLTLTQVAEMAAQVASSAHTHGMLSRVGGFTRSK
jgi:hypothetical protein